MPALVLAAAVSSSCASPKAVESAARAERRDTLRAVLAEELKMRLDDVVIIPPDSLGPRIVAARVELRRDRGISVSRRTEYEAETTERETPKPGQSPWRPPIWVALAAGIGAYIAGAWRRE